jgi:hypothetical protein
MTDLTPSETTNLDRYGSAALDWARAHAAYLPGIDLVLDGSAERVSDIPLHLHTAIGVATAEPYGATRWRFPR